MNKHYTLRLFNFTLLFLIGFLGFAQVTATAPFFENFDNNFLPGTGTSNIGSTIDSNWFRTNYPFGNNTEYFWGGGTGSSSNQNTGPSADHTTGSGSYAYAESSNFKQSRAKLITPYIDLDTLSNPQLTFWKHQFGSDVKNFSVQIAVNGFFGGSIYFTTGSQSNQWEKITIPLTNYIGQTVAFIFVAGRNTDSPGNGLADCAIDDVEVNNPPVCPPPQAQHLDSISNFSLSYNAFASTGVNLSYQWDFGDGNSDFDAVGTHLYSGPGVYNLRLIVTDHCGQADTLFKSIAICDTAISSFSYTQSGVNTILDASNSSFTGSQYSWDFGDGSSDTGKVVSHIYASSGSYNVTLTITNLCGQTYSINQIITTCSKPEALWSYAVVSSGSSGLTIQFFGQNSIGGSNYFWDFGDGSTNSSSSIPSHTYAVPSLSYVVTLIVSNNCGSSDTLISSLAQLSEIESEPIYEELSLYPNPTTGPLVIDFGQSIDEKVDYEVLTIEGRLVQSKQGQMKSRKLTIDNLDLPAGEYLLQVKQNGNWLRRKFVIIN